MKKLWKILIIVLIVLALLLGGGIAAISLSAQGALHTIDEYRATYSDVAFEETDDGGICVRPVGEASAGLVFYTGALIEPLAYAPLIAKIARGGVACFVPKSPLNLLPVGTGVTEAILRDDPDIKDWYFAGHSMGGTAAAYFAEEHPEDVKGLVMLASYATRDISDAAYPLLTIYGDRDTVLNAGRYQKQAEIDPQDRREVVIEGGNHAQFGDYGRQKRDSDAVISAEEQWEVTAEAVVGFIQG